MEKCTVFDKPIFIIQLFLLFTMQFHFLHCTADTVRSATIQSKLGPIRGQMYELPDGSTGSSFLGINYAKPPTGQRRFRAPEPSDPWEDVYDATEFGPSCYQPEMFDVWMVANKPDSFPDTSDIIDHPLGFAEQSHFHDEAINVMKAFLAGKGKESLGLNKRSSSNEQYPPFNGEDFTGSLAAELMEFPGKKPKLTDEVTGTSDDIDEKHGHKRYLVQDYLMDVSEDCLSLNVYTPLFTNENKYFDNKNVPPRVKRHSDFFVNRVLSRGKGKLFKNRVETPNTAGTIVKENLLHTDNSTESEQLFENNPRAALRHNYQKYSELVANNLNYDIKGIFKTVYESPGQNTQTKNNTRVIRSATDPNDVEEIDLLDVNDIKNDNTDGNNDDIEEEIIQSPERSDLPVLVYVHGGSYFCNAGRLYPGEKLASTGMVVVTINYRLGAFGFLSTGDSSARGNWGLLDQRLALQWVRDNIGAFGGDPSKVLLAGNSAGGASVLLQLFSPRSKGLFSRVAAMSGSSLSPWAIQKRPEKFARRLADSLDCHTNSSEAIMTCLRTVDQKAIMKKFTEQLADGLWISFAPVVEGDWGPEAFLPYSPLDVLKGATSFSTKVPVLITITKDEVSIWYRQSPDELKLFQIESWIGKIASNIFVDVKLASRNLAAVIHTVRGEYLYSLGYQPSALNETPIVHYEHPAIISKKEVEYPSHFPNDTAPVSIISKLISDVGLLVPSVEEAGLLADHTTVYMAQFVFESPDDIKIEGQSWIGAYHEHELQYLFGFPHLHLENSLKDPSNKNFSDTIMEIFRSYADSGVPSAPGGEWPLYERPGDPILAVGLDTNVKHNFLMDRISFWRKFIPLLTKWPINYHLDVNSAASSTLMTSPEPGMRSRPNLLPEMTTADMLHRLGLATEDFFSNLNSCTFSAVAVVLVITIHRNLGLEAR